MNDKCDTGATGSKIDKEHATDLRYVAYCDILGFSSRVLHDFNGTREIYRQFGDLMAMKPMDDDEVTFAMYSDSILVTSPSLAKILQAVQHVSFFALSSDFLIRGGIAKGNYWEHRQGNDLLVVSDALIRAVKLEASVSVPAVVLADDIEIPDDFWLFQYSRPGAVVQTPLLHFRDRNIVNPFNIFWLLTAGHRAERLMEQSPDHREKYLWFLALHAAVTEKQPLIPPAVLNRFLREGKLVHQPTESENSDGTIGNDIPSTN